MEIESIRVSLRERNPWQAIDLGFNITRKYSATLYKSYFLGFLMVVLPTVILLRNYPSWAGFVIWYLKPIIELGPQVLLSRIIFGEDFTNRQIISVTLNAMKRFWWASLTSLRFSIRRSFVMPVFLLEGLKPALRRKRLRTLSLGQSQGPTSLTILLSHAEMLFYLVILFIIYQFIPVYERVDPLIIFTANSDHLGFQWLSILCWLVSIILIAPFYLSSGFALYLNKRIELEGWDLELSFKKIKNRLTPFVSHLGSLMLLFFSVTYIADLNAEEAIPEPIKHKPLEVTPISRDDSLPSLEDLIRKDPVNNSSDSIAEEKDTVVKVTEEIVYDSEINDKTRDDIKKILENEPLVNIPEENFWQWKDDGSSDSSEANINLSGVSFMLEALLWAGVVALVIWLILQIPQLKPINIKGDGPKRVKREADVFGVVLEQEEIDQDLKILISRAMARNDFRKVLALLLASALGELTLHTTKRIPRGATESDCLKLAQKIQMNTAWLKWFELLLMKWSHLAWGHKNLAKEQIEKLVTNAPLEELQTSSGVNNG